MRQKLLSLLFLCGAFGFLHLRGQAPCSKPEFRQFDFWIGSWNVYALNGQQAGTSNISLILDSCIILEEWTGTNNTPQGSLYSGKSYNKYNPATRQWQQTWVDNVGGSTEFLRGVSEKDKITFYADRVVDRAGKVFRRKLTFYKLADNKVRQHGERSDDGGTTWTTEYDLEYRKKS